jgi:hypothetical protein
MANMYPWLESYGHPDKNIKIDHEASGMKSSVFRENSHMGTFRGIGAPARARDLAHRVHNDASIRADNSSSM